MAAEFVSAGAVSVAGNTSNITVALPGTVTAGNLLVIIAALSGRSFSSITQSYTQIRSATGMWVGFKFAGASEVAPVLTATGNMSSGSAVMVQYSGVTGTTFDAAGTIATTTGTSLTATAVTTTATWDLVLSLFTGGGSTSTFFSGPVGATPRVANIGTAGSNGLLFTDQLQEAIGTTGTKTATISTSASIAGVVVAFKGSGAPPQNPRNFFVFMT